ncbi:MAG: cation diffusion facilitator family transporter [Planctomycetota bacterium]|jgi:cation diffusion facilitator family transporter
MDEGHSAARLQAARFSVVIGVLILVIKMTAWLSTGSIAIMSDALESVVHVVATLVMYVALRLSEAPPDDDHPYGHGRAAAFSVGFEGGLVALSGLLVIWAAGRRMLVGGEVEELALGMAWTALAAVINLFLGVYLLQVARRTASDVLRADGHHVLSDVWTSVVAIVGVALVALTGQVWLDAAVGMLAGGHLLLVGGRLVREATDALMDAADPAVIERIVAVLNRQDRAAVLDVHRLRAHRVGDRYYVDFHLVVPGEWTVIAAHELVDALEVEILATLGGGGAVIIHLDHPGISPVHTSRQAMTPASATRSRAADPTE